MKPPGFGEIAERLRRATVQVIAGRRGHGSGVIVGSGGVIVRNAHVATSVPIEVELWDGSRAPAQISRRDTVRDIAILRTTLSGLPAAPLGDSDRLRVGEIVMAIGNPFGFLGALTTGVVHGIGRVPGLGPMRWVQAAVRLAPGNSGGPLADASGRVVGINTMIAGGAGLAVPSNTVSRILRGGDAQSPLGIAGRTVSFSIDGRPRFGLLILEVLKNGAAETASLMLGDILIGAQDRNFDSLDDFERVLDGSGERLVSFQFLRGDRSKIRKVAVRLGLPGMAAA